MNNLIKKKNLGTLKNELRKNYNLTSQTANRFANSPTNYQCLDYALILPKRFKKAHFIKICL
jgi:hypothetical protein